MISNKQGPRNNIQCFCHAGPSIQMHYLNYDVILHKLVNIINLLFKNSFNKEYGPIIDQHIYTDLLIRHDNHTDCTLKCVMFSNYRHISVDD